jgi:hypothetical protein
MSSEHVFTIEKTAALATARTRMEKEHPGEEFDFAVSNERDKDGKFRVSCIPKGKKRRSTDPAGLKGEKRHA